MSLSIPVSDSRALSVIIFGGVWSGDSSSVYQMARHYDLPVQGLYVANDGYCLDVGGIKADAVITKINGKDVQTLDEL